MRGLEYAQKVFNVTTSKNLELWNALILAKMQSTGLRPTPTSIVGVLLACSNTLSFRYERAAHGHIMRRGLLSSLPIATSLADMHAKCGSIKLASMVFERHAFIVGDKSH